MKELSVEEKAKAYDKAIKRAEGLIDFCSDSELKTLEYVFPKLRESEDEKIKKDLLGYLHTLPNHFSHNGGLVTEWIAWLEKQGEQKSAWSEEDEKMFDYALDMIEWYSDKNEDKSRLVSDWLKSLKQRYTWKPSDKQMNALDSTLQYSQVSHNSFEHLNSLFNDLKKLREE